MDTCNKMETASLAGTISLGMHAAHARGHNFTLFHPFHPQAALDPSSILEELLDLLVVSKPDWT